ncbi:DUF2141 domain-containing protein [Polaribacter sp.]|uniref:DUF2141 domain-containing protein n=1 Tax=Polaribacter sp. TaxID=1920175 RepID=UPI0025D5225D|nr:DUF2141 domain-containing protein [Polaribacter sp.]
MKYFLTFCFITYSYFFSFNAQEANFNLTIEILGIKTNTGKVYLALYDNTNDFLKKKREFIGAKSEVKNGKSIVFFKNIKKGEYAASIFYDENNNGKMDTKLFGVPKEPYGFSNNAKGFMGPPSFKEAKFTLASNKKIKILLK